MLSSMFVGNVQLSLFLKNLFFNLHCPLKHPFLENYYAFKMPTLMPIGLAPLEGF